jgi:hypothetical protein
MTLLEKDNQEAGKTLSKVIAKTWVDQEFKQRLILEPEAVLEENGLTLPSGVEVRVRETSCVESLTIIDVNLDSDSHQVYEIPLPPKPTELTDSQIQSWTDGDNIEDIMACL